MDTPKVQRQAVPLVQMFILKYYRYLTTIIVAVILIAGYGFILQPKYQAVSQGGQFNLDTLKSEETKRQLHLANLQDLSKSFSSIKSSDIVKLESILPSDSDIPGLFVQLERLALKNNLFLSSIDINEAPESVRVTEAISGVFKVDINLNLVGSRAGDYKGLKLFLADLENSLRLFDVNSVFFSPDSFEYSVNIVAYYYP